jgi:hypothetical protein
LAFTNKGKNMNQQDEMHEVMNEMEERLEIALNNLEYHASFISADDIDVIRAACGKPRNSQVNPLLRDVINDFGNVFGLQNFPTIWSKK